VAKSRKSRMTEEARRPRRQEERLHLPESADAWELYDLEGNPIPVQNGPLSHVVQGGTFREWKVRIHNKRTGRERRLT
jgi:hypothetical protein